MSWEEDFREKYPCPCGKGEFLMIHYSNDWNQSEIQYKMLCHDCKKNYVYDHTIIHGHPGNEIERGWVLKSILKKEKLYRDNVEKNIKRLYFKHWESKFLNLRQKKQMWKVLSVNGKYYPSLGTFYNHTRRNTQKDLIKYINGYFNYYNLKQILEVCEIKPNLKLLGINKDELDNLF